MSEPLSGGEAKNEEVNPVVCEPTAPPSGHTRASLFEVFNESANQNVAWNNWNMGCNDLAFAAPFFRAISDRLYKTGPKKLPGRPLIFDVGANDGQDVATTLGAFHEIRGMCKSWTVWFVLFSVEPSPTVFCNKLLVAAAEQNWSRDHLGRFYLLNMALSDTAGQLRFKDTGNEVGKLVGGSDDTNGSSSGVTRRINATEFAELQKCRTSFEGAGAVDAKSPRLVTVPTRTLDLLVDSLQNQIVIVHPGDQVFILKIDTEGHDFRVLKGASNLLDKKRITFVLFEVGESMRVVSEFMYAKGYMCFLFTPHLLIPVDGADWWFHKLDVVTNWWANGICGIRGSHSLGMFWRMFHSDDAKMAAAFELI